MRGLGGDVNAVTSPDGSIVIAVQIPLVANITLIQLPKSAPSTPVPISPTSSSQEAAQSTLPVSPTTRRPVILSVDDDSIHQVVIHNILHTMFELVQVGDGVEAMEYLNDPNNATPDLVLLDNMMPRMNGPETCKRIREKFADKYVSFITICFKRY